MKLSTSITINESIEKVWDIFMDESKMKLWMSHLENFETIKGQPGKVGSQFKVKFNENGRETIFLEKVTAVKPNELYAFKMIHNALESDVEVRLTTKNGQTQLSQLVDMKAKKLSWKFLLPLMKGQMIKRQNQDLQKLKALIEH